MVFSSSNKNYVSVCVLCCSLLACFLVMIYCRLCSYIIYPQMSYFSNLRWSVCLCLAAVRFAINGRPVGALIQINRGQNENGQMNDSQNENSQLDGSHMHVHAGGANSSTDVCNNISSHSHSHSGDGGNLVSIKLVNGSQGQNVNEHGANGAHQGRESPLVGLEPHQIANVKNGDDRDVEADTRSTHEEQTHVAHAYADEVQNVHNYATLVDTISSKTWHHGGDFSGRKRMCAGVSVGAMTKAVVVLSACWSLAEDVDQPASEH
jgi:hypothetical protein